MVEVIQSLSAMRSLEKAWNDLAEPFMTPLLRYEWFEACAEALSPTDRLSIIVVRSGEKITAIVPLVHTKKNGLGRLELLGASQLHEPTGFIYENENSLREAVDFVMAMRKPVFLNKLNKKAAEFHCLQQIGKDRALCLLREAGGSPWLHITGDWSRYEAGLSSSRRSAFRRARKKAEEKGRIQYEILIPDLDRIESGMEEVYRVESAGWKRRNRSAMASNVMLKKFFSVYACSTARLGMLRLCFFRINDEPVATLMGVEYAGRFWVLKVGYDEVFAKCSPGMLLMHETIKYAFEKGLKAYEFLGDNEEWLQIWTDKTHSHASFRIYPYSLRGAAVLANDLFHAAAGKVQSMRAWR